MQIRSTLNKSQHLAVNNTFYRRTSLELFMSQEWVSKLKILKIEKTKCHKVKAHILVQLPLIRQLIVN